MKVSNIVFGYEKIREVKQLMDEAFPKREQMPWLFLRIMALRKSIHFLAFEDKGNLIGITYCLEGKKTVFILYLAVNGKIRSKGYGGKIMESLKENFEGKDIALNIEPVMESASNYEQRKRRLSFYEKHGFHETRYYLLDGKDPDDIYSVLSTVESFSEEDYKEAVAQFSFGLSVPEVKQMRSV